MIKRFREAIALSIILFCTLGAGIARSDEPDDKAPSGLEALVNPQTGDIIVVKPAGSPWGTEELKQFFVIRISKEVADSLLDQNLKSVLQRLLTKLEETGRGGEPFPVEAYPFAQYAETSRRVGDSKAVIKERRQVQQSRWYVNVTLVEAQLKPEVLNTSVQKEVVEVDQQDLSSLMAVKPDPSLSEGEVLLKQEETY